MYKLIINKDMGRHYLQNSAFLNSAQKKHFRRTHSPRRERRHDSFICRGIACGHDGNSDRRPAAGLLRGPLGLEFLKESDLSKEIFKRSWIMWNSRFAFFMFKE